MKKEEFLSACVDAWTHCLAVVLDRTNKEIRFEAQFHAGNALKQS